MLNTNSSGFSVQWVNPANAKVESTWCTVIVGALADLAHCITFGLVGEAGNIGSIQQQLTQEIMSSLPNVGTVGPLLDGTTTQIDQLLVNLKVPASLAPSVEIDVPYSAFDVPRTPTRLPPGQVVGLLANGLGMRDDSAANQPAPCCNPVRTGCLKTRRQPCRMNTRSRAPVRSSIPALK